MKYILWIPADHKLLLIRVYIWAFLAMISTREYYNYITEKNYYIFGPYLWISHIIIFTEWMIIYKFSDGIFTEPFPDYVKYIWAIIFTCIFAIFSKLIFKDLTKNKGKKKAENFTVDHKIDEEYIDE